jgi:alpha-tubulin suppressor-like RCC1 family protein
VVGEFGSGHRMTMIDTDNFLTCGLQTDGVVYCSGSAWKVSYNGIPTPVGGSVVFRSVAVGYWHGCGLDALGAAYCWGFNDRGQFGTGTVGEFTHTSMPVSGGHVFARIYAFDWTTCGVTIAGETMCWGANHGGVLGRTRISSSAVPIPLGIGLGAHSIDRHGEPGHACAVDGERRLVCWGGVAVTAPPPQSTRSLDDHSTDHH